MTPPLDTTAGPWLARRFAPAGPPRLQGMAAAGAAVYAVPGRYCVTQIIEGPNSLVLVDVGSTADIVRLARMIDWLGKPVAWVVPSHLHFDHVMGLEAAASRFDAALAVGRRAADLIRRRRRQRLPANLTARLWMRVWLQQGLPGVYPRDLPRGLRFILPWLPKTLDPAPARVLDDGDGLPGFAGWQVLDSPGHADEAICLFHRRSGILVAGDTIINFEGGEWNRLVTDEADFAATRRRLRDLAVRAVLCGHGPAICDQAVLARLFG